MLDQDRSVENRHSAYPVLARCLAHGLHPSSEEVERLAARIMREVTPSLALPSRPLSRRAITAALAAIEGPSYSPCHRSAGPAGRGH